MLVKSLKRDVYLSLNILFLTYVFSMLLCLCVLSKKELNKFKYRIYFTLLLYLDNLEKKVKILISLSVCKYFRRSVGSIIFNCDVKKIVFIFCI